MLLGSLLLLSLRSVRCQVKSSVVPADELMVVSDVFDPALRRRSVELIARAAA